MKASILDAYYFFPLTLSSCSSRMIELENLFYLRLRNFPRQKRIESSLQQHSPKHSPFLLCIRIKSSKNHGPNKVRNEKYSITTQHPQQKQKLLNAGELEIEPMKNEIPSVTEVIVIEGPANVRPILNLSFADK